jgi:lipase chaperone LimK
VKSKQYFLLVSAVPAIWFRLIKAKFTAAGIWSQKIKYANALTNLHKQVLRAISDTVNACNEPYHPCDDLKAALLGQFGKSK